MLRLPMVACVVVMGVGLVSGGCERKQEAPVKPGASESAAPAGAPATSSDAISQEAQAKLQQVMTYIKENKLDLAEKTLDEVEKMKSSLPASLQQQVDKARSLLNSAKATSGKLPGGMNLPQ